MGANPIYPKKWVPRQELLGLHPFGFRCQTKEVSDAAQISSLLAQLMVLRGHDNPQAAELYLSGNLKNLPDPAAMKDMDKAVKRIIRCLESGKVPYLSGDYDSDGTNALALLVSFFNWIRVKVPWFVPHREKHGYGLSADMIREAAQNGYDLIITVDCGTSAHKEIELANSLGVDVIATDHHRPPESLPPAYAILNPHQPGCEFADKNLCGVGIAFFLTIALRKKLRDMRKFNDIIPEPDLRELLPFVALGTVCDLVPLTGVNRILVQAGLKVLAGRTWPGLAALTDISGVKKLTAGALGFYLGPRLNSCGRLESADIGVQLLLAQDTAQAQHLAAWLHQVNAQRQEIEEKVFKMARKRIENGECPGRTIVLADPKFHAGVQGICASTLVETYHRPSILISVDGDMGKASGRSIKGFDLFKALQQCSHLLEKYGGHEYAAGLSIKTENIPAFIKVFEEIAQKELSEEDLMPKASYDVELELNDINLGMVESLDRLAPFGVGNPSPAFVARSVEIENIKTLKDKHVKFTAVQNNNRIDAIAFNMAERLGELMTCKVDLLFSIGINEWNGRRTPQIEAKDWRTVTEFDGGLF